MTHKWVQNQKPRAIQAGAFFISKTGHIRRLHASVDPGTPNVGSEAHRAHGTSPTAHPEEHSPRGARRTGQRTPRRPGDNRRRGTDHWHHVPLMPRPRMDATRAGRRGPTMREVPMARAKHPCAEPGCPIPTPAGTSRCHDHTRARDKARGSRQARGYDAKHDRTRAALAPIVAAGRATCWRCGAPIAPGEPWDLGHHDHDRSITMGPEHANACNRSAAGRASHGLAPR